MLPSKSKVKVEVKMEVDVKQEQEETAEAAYQDDYERIRRSSGFGSTGQRPVEASGSGLRPASSYPNPSFSPPRRGVDDPPLHRDPDPRARYYVYDDPRIRAPPPPKMTRRDVGQEVHYGAPTPTRGYGHGQRGGGGQESLAFTAPLLNLGRGHYHQSQSPGSFGLDAPTSYRGRGQCLSQDRGQGSSYYGVGAPPSNHGRGQSLSEYRGRGQGQGPSSYGFGATISNIGRGRGQPLSQFGSQGSSAFGTAISDRGRGRCGGRGSSTSSGDFFAEFRVPDETPEEVPKKDDWVQPCPEEAWAEFKESLQESTRAAMLEGKAPPEELEETQRKIATGRGWESDFNDFGAGVSNKKAKVKGQGGSGKAKGFKASGYIMFLQDRKRRMGDKDNLSLDELIRKYNADWKKLSEDERQAWKNRVKS